MGVDGHREFDSGQERHIYDRLNQCLKESNPCNLYMETSVF